MDNCFDKDSYGATRFNLYLFLKADFEFHKILSDIKKALIANVKFNKHYKNDKELKKLSYFIKYHNQKVSECSQDLREFLIDEKIFFKD